jgi:benzoyl-CoA reductase/2-hydroxyglutaryl-CoA dehydratase subunit BcrC/BadD/HgdB
LKSCWLLLYAFKVDVLKVLRQLALYVTIGRPEISKRINYIKQDIKQRNINNMMQWLDRFCRYETFGTKTLKTELRLKSYRVFKF